jgi:RND superfamily putative drug exporter
VRNIGYGGVATVLVDMIGALTVLPALLTVLGPKVNSLRGPRPRRDPGAGAARARDDATAGRRELVGARTAPGPV